MSSIAISGKDLLAATRSDSTYALYAKKCSTLNGRTIKSATPSENAEKNFNLAGNFLSISRSIIGTVTSASGTELSSRASKSIQATKFTAVVDVGLSARDAVNNIKPLVTSSKKGSEREEEIVNNLLELSGNMSYITDGVNMITEATTATVKMSAKAAGVLGRIGTVSSYASSVFGIAFYIIDVKSLIKCRAAYKTISENKIQASPEQVAIFKKRIIGTVFSTALSMLSTTLAYAAFAIFALGTLTPLGWAAYAASTSVVVGIKLAEWYSDRQMKTQLLALPAL